MIEKDTREQVLAVDRNSVKYNKRLNRPVARGQGVYTGNTFIFVKKSEPDDVRVLAQPLKRPEIEEIFGKHVLGAGVEIDKGSDEINVKIDDLSLGVWRIMTEIEMEGWKRLYPDVNL